MDTRISYMDLQRPYGPQLRTTLLNSLTMRKYQIRMCTYKPCAVVYVTLGQCQEILLVIMYLLSFPCVSPVSFFLTTSI